MYEVYEVYEVYERYEVYITHRSYRIDCTGSQPRLPPYDAELYV